VRLELRPMLDWANMIWLKKIPILPNDVYAHLSDTDFEAKLFRGEYFAR
jgi:hypothetical protein